MPIFGEQSVVTDCQECKLCTRGEDKTGQGQGKLQGCAGAPTAHSAESWKKLKEAAPDATQR